MNTKTHSPARDLVLAALFLALAFVLPMITGHVPQVGNMLCPMHFPVLLAGFVLGGPWGLALGFLAPLLRSVLFGMPPLYPIAIAMAFELATYGAVAGWMYKKVRHTCGSCWRVCPARPSRSRRSCPVRCSPPSPASSPSSSSSRSS